MTAFAGINRTPFIGPIERREHLAIRLAKRELDRWAGREPPREKEPMLVHPDTFARFLAGGWIDEQGRWR